MNNLQLFAYEGREIRFVGTPENPEWVAADVVHVLYPKAARSSYGKYLGTVPDEWKGKKKILTLGGQQSLVTVFEPGLYALIARSNSPIAVPFQKWVYEEVLPSIRKTGSYSLQPSPTPTPTPADRLEQLETEIRKGLDEVEAGRSRVWKAAAQIQAEKLWKDAGFKNFEEYGKERWGWNKSNIYEITRAGKITAQLEAAGVAPENLPTAVAQIRPLLKVDPEQRAEVWQDVIDTHPAPTRDRVSAVVDQQYLSCEEANELLQCRLAIDECRVMFRRAISALNRFDNKSTRYHLTAAQARLRALLCNLADEIAGNNLAVRQILRECHLILEGGVLSIDFPSREVRDDLMNDNNMMMAFIYGCAGVDATSIDLLIDGEFEIQFDVHQAIGYDRWCKRKARREE